MADEVPALTASKRAAVRPETQAVAPKPAVVRRMLLADLRALHSPAPWLHAAASVLHGWAEQEHATGKPVRLTVEDYGAALKAAERPGEGGDYVPHAPASSDAVKARIERAAKARRHP